MMVEKLTSLNALYSTITVSGKVSICCVVGVGALRLKANHDTVWAQGNEEIAGLRRFFGHEFGDPAVLACDLTFSVATVCLDAFTIGFKRFTRFLWTRACRVGVSNLGELHGSIALNMICLNF